MRKNWKKEVMFDIRALGSEFFFVLVFIRSLIGPYFPFAFNIFFAGLSIFLISLFFRKFDGYIARGLVLMVLVSAFYDSPLFYVLAVILFLSFIFIFKKLKMSGKEICWGIAIGVISVIIGYLAGNFLTSYYGLYHPHGV